MLDIVIVMIVLGSLTAVVTWWAGWDYLMFGVAAGLAVMGRPWIWFGLAIALTQSVRLVWLRWGSRSRPIRD